MSILLGQVATGALNAAVLQQSDDRAMQKTYQWDYAGTRAQLDPFADGMLWPCSRFGGGDGAAMPFLMGNESLSSGRFENDQQDVLGGSQRKKLIGTTLDSAGNPLGSCLVQGIVTATEVFASQCTSDAGGYFELCTPYTGAHYLVCYKAGSPDVAGTSANTLVPV